jgi:DNA-binding NtrC family response regulator
MGLEQKVDDALVLLDSTSEFGGGRHTRAISKDVLVAQGAARLAEILMRICLKHPDVAKELSNIADPGETRAHCAANGQSAESYMVGSCAKMQAVFSAIRKFAMTDAPVLLTGESGTGKEIAALEIHERSKFANGPFVAINCAGLPTNLIAAELFGHEKGAFTGAVGRRIGRIEAADEGTLFLDEIGDLPLELQKHLLRFLQHRTIERLGGNQSLCINTRVIAATNVDLERAVAEGKFREDLFFRLDVLRIHMPPLCGREEDIETLVKYFVEQACREFGVETLKITPRALRALKCYAWPGNVRELISKMRRAVVMAEGIALDVQDFDIAGSAISRLTARNVPANDQAEPVGAKKPRLAKARANAETRAVFEALEKSQYNITQAAKDLGVSRVTIYKLMDRHRIQRTG